MIDSLLKGALKFFLFYISMLFFKGVYEAIGSDMTFMLLVMILFNQYKGAKDNDYSEVQTK